MTIPTEISYKTIKFDFKGEATNYLSHGIHPYPAKFPPQLPQQILSRYAKAGQTILDPFCGSGTTLVEAKLQGIHGIGVDVNGLACLLTQVKCADFDENALQAVSKFMSEIDDTILQYQFGKPLNTTVKQIEGLAHWFQTNVAQELSFILEEIESVSHGIARDFLKICFSAIIVRVSNQESDTRFAAINKNIPNIATLYTFKNKVQDYLSRVVAFANQVPKYTTCQVFNADSRDLSFIETASVDLILTSPPYANTYDYYLYHKFRKRWLDLDVKFAQYNEIGSRREFSSLKKDPEKWNEDLKCCFSEMVRVLKPEGKAFIVIGDSVIRKQLIKVDDVIKNFVGEIGFSVLEILSSDLAKHSRLFNPSFAQKGKQEHLIILQKV